VIPVFNGQQTIAGVVESVLAQTLPTSEIIVVDDGSTDETASILNQFVEQITVVRQENRGFCTARNSGIDKSSGEYIALLDSDDFWIRTKLEKSMRRFEENPASVLVYTDVANIDVEGRELGTSPVNSETAHAPSMDEMLNDLWPIMPSTVVMRRDAYEESGRFADGFSEDLDFWIRIRERGEFSYIPEKLTRFTVGPLYPKVLRRDNRAELFLEAISRRYGPRADGVLRSFRKHKKRILRNAGLAELKKGNRSAARRCLVRSLHYDPMAFKTYLRIARTFLPKRVDAAPQVGGSATSSHRSSSVRDSG
jgi:glycosyltransferase involved in cell wall biosynthesis